ncbi:YdiU family protein [Alphaproteobacteria bacterium]|nr:YdiU family protein [Alphaproteobacteria bacterium]
MLNNWNFENSYLELPDIFYSKTKAENFPKLELILKNKDLMDTLNINHENFDNLLLDTIYNKKLNSFSQAYAGHQFGHFTILGDGRATLLGEHINNNKERFDIQLKGSGKTPYSRNGDGKGTLKSMLREYIVSEAMHNLNIKTTRSLAILNTGQKIRRETFEDGGVLVRVAKSHIRVGTFQLASLSKKQSDIKELLEYSINRLYPELLNEDDKYLKFFEKITIEQMNLILDWQRVGFVHGVMNTDNMSLSGETIDYGPCAFLDEYNPNKVFSSIDKNGRYAFNNQPKIALWNLARLAETFLHLVDSKEEIAIKKIEYILKKYETEYNDKWLEMMKNKIGINDNHEKDNELIKELLDLMQIFKLDYTNTFLLIENNTLQKFDFMLDWISKLNQRKELNKKIKKPKYSNPKIVPRNHIVEKVLNESTNGNFKNLNKFISLLKNPYESSIPDEYIREPSNEEKVYQTFCGT